MTRTSRAIASSILRKFSACASAAWNSILSSFDTPSTSSATGLPKRSSVFLGDVLVLDHVVQQRGHERLGVELPVGADLGDRERMRDVRLARLADLAEVRRVGEAEGPLDLLDLVGREVFGEPGIQMLDGCGAGCWAAWSDFGRDWFLGRAVGSPGYLEPDMFESAGVRFIRKNFSPIMLRHLRICWPGDSVIPLRPEGRPLPVAYLGTFFSISMPTLPAAISRRAMTVGLSLASTFGEWPAPAGARDRWPSASAGNGSESA